MKYRILVAYTGPEKDQLLRVIEDAGHITQSVIDYQQFNFDENVIERYDLAVIETDFVTPGGGYVFAKHLRNVATKRQLGILLITRRSPYKHIEKEEIRRIYDEILFLPISREELYSNIERLASR